MPLVSPGHIIVFHAGCRFPECTLKTFTRRSELRSALLRISFFENSAIPVSKAFQRTLMHFAWFGVKE